MYLCLTTPLSGLDAEKGACLYLAGWLYKTAKEISPTQGIFKKLVFATVMHPSNHINWCPHLLHNPFDLFVIICHIHILTYNPILSIFLTPVGECVPFFYCSAKYHDIHGAIETINSPLFGCLPFSPELLPSCQVHHFTDLKEEPVLQYVTNNAQAHKTVLSSLL